MTDIQVKFVQHVLSLEGGRHIRVTPETAANMTDILNAAGDGPAQIDDENGEAHTVFFSDIICLQAIEYVPRKAVI